MNYQNDPFFKARNVGFDYLRDVHRTYGAPVPSATFEKALQFRQREKTRIEAMVQENEKLRKENAYYRNLNKRAAMALTKLSKQTIATDGASASSSDRSTGNDRVPPVLEPVKNEPVNVRTEVLPTDVPSACGHGAEHSVEGRSATDDGVGEQPVGGGVAES